MTMSEGISSFQRLRALLERNELGLYRVSEVVNVTVVGDFDSMVVVYHLVGAEPHSAHDTCTRVAVVKGDRVTHSLIVG